MFTGSGMPMRFADTDGTMIDVYQAATQMTDESGQSYPATPNALLDNALGPLGYYGAFTANMHTDQATTFEDDQLLASATSRGVPIISAAQLLTWLDGRNGSSFGNLSWSGSTLSFSVAVGTGANGLTGMVPTVAAGGVTLTGLTRAGAAVPFTRTTVKGVEYAFFSAAAGSYTASYGTSTAAPTATGLAASTTSGGATVRWSTDRAATSTVVYGRSPSSLTSTTTDRVPTTSHQVELAGLDPSRKYYYRVLSKDPRGRTTTTPAPTAPPAVLTVGSPDTTAPRLSAVGAEPLPDSTATLTWNSSEAADGTVSWGTSADRLDEAGYAAGPDSRHAVVLTGLRPDTTYYYRVVSVDAAGNRTMWPAAGDQPAAFVSAGYGVADHTLAQFRVGSRAGTYLSQGGFGEVRLTPGLRTGRHASAGTLTSRVLSADQMATWDRAYWTAQLPAGTAIAVRVRLGSTPEPDATWTAWQRLAGPGSRILGSSRFLQYELVLTSRVAGSSPVLSSIGFTNNGQPAPSDRETK
jgi:hypothetical protein